MGTPSSRRFRLRVGADSHRGAVRGENQDRISRFRSPFGEVFAVADGMGGHLDGGRAAELTLELLREELGRLPADLPLAEALAHAARKANGELLRGSGSGGEASRSRMGATLVLAVIRGSRAVVAHAGDSRAYLARAGSLEALTRDHTLVQGMVDHRVLSAEEARRHPDASIVTRAFGQAEEIELEVAEPIELAAGDRLLLCSDGLCGYVDDLAIERTLGDHADAQEATDRLIELALAAGGEDNVSVQVIQVESAPARADGADSPAKGTPAKGTPVKGPPASSGGIFQRAWLWLGLVAVIAVSLAAGFTWWLR